MTKFALVEPTGRVAQIAEKQEDAFPVAEPFEWVECGDNVDLAYSYSDGEFTPLQQESPIYAP